MPNEIIEGTESNLTPTVTVDVAKAKIKLSLTVAELNLQAVQDAADALVYNEDNLVQINETITALKKIETKIDDAFEEGKRPYLLGGRAWDAAKNDLKGLTSPILTKVTNEHARLCQAIEARRVKNAAEEKRKKDIGDKINATILGFSQEITACTNSVMLQTIQNRINAEQGRKTTYQEYLPTLVERCAELNQPLKDQKEAIKKLEELERDTQTAIETGNDELLQEVENKKEEITGKINENKVRVEESAINSSIRSGGGGGYTQTFPEVKTKRRTWKHEVKNVEALYKKFPHLVTLTPNDEKIKELLKTKIAEGATKDVEELDYMGVIRFFVDKKYS